MSMQGPSNRSNACTSITAQKYRETRTEIFDISSKEAANPALLKKSNEIKLPRKTEKKNSWENKWFYLKIPNSNRLWATDNWKARKKSWKPIVDIQNRARPNKAEKIPTYRGSAPQGLGHG